MKKFIAIYLLLISFLYGEVANTTAPEGATIESDKQLFQFYENIPAKIYKNQIFTLKVKSLVPTENFEDLYSSLSGALNVQIMNAKPKWVKIDATTYTLNLYLKAKAPHMVTPTVATTLTEGGNEIAHATLAGMEVSATEVIPQTGWCRVLGRSFTIPSYKIDRYDGNNNIIVLEVKSEMGNVEDFNLPFASKQGIDSVTGMVPSASMYYYAIIPSTMKMLEFTYFNTAAEKFTPVKLDIDFSKIDENKVSTQLDINPKDDNKTLLKAAFLLFICVVFGGLYYFKRNPLFFIPIGLALLMMIALFIPEDKVVVKPGADVTILPTTVSTVFQKIAQDTKAKKLKEVDGFVKILFDDGRVGWVKKEFVK